jgi:hypothetical protein
MESIQVLVHALRQLHRLAVRVLLSALDSGVGRKLLDLFVVVRVVFLIVLVMLNITGKIKLKDSLKLESAFVQYSVVRHVVYAFQIGHEVDEFHVFLVKFKRQDGNAIA